MNKQKKTIKQKKQENKQLRNYYRLKNRYLNAKKNKKTLKKLQILIQKNYLIKEIKSWLPLQNKKKKLFVIKKI